MLFIISPCSRFSTSCPDCSSELIQIQMGQIAHKRQVVRPWWSLWSILEQHWNLCSLCAAARSPSKTQLRACQIPQFELRKRCYLAGKDTKRNQTQVASAKTPKKPRLKLRRRTAIP